MGLSVNSAWEELGSLCVLWTPLFHGLQVGTTLWRPAPFHTTSPPPLTAPANKINRLPKCLPSVIEVSCLYCCSLLWFFIQYFSSPPPPHFKVISFLLPSSLSPWRLCIRPGSTRCLPLPATPPRSIFLPHCSLAMLKPARKPLPWLPSLLWFPSGSSPSLLLVLLAPEFYLPRNSLELTETPSLSPFSENLSPVFTLVILGRGAFSF